MAFGDGGKFSATQIAQLSQIVADALIPVKEEIMANTKSVVQTAVRESEDRIHKRLDKVEERLDGVETRLDVIESHLGFEPEHKMQA